MTLIDWPEPFGLVMIEAMACGTPVVAFAHGAVPEVIDDGVTGFIVDNEEQAAAAVAKLPELPRAGVRRHFEKRFTSMRMAEDYLHIYRKVIGDAPVRPLFQGVLDRFTGRTNGAPVPVAPPEVAAE